ncbi:MAG TPA: Crp/Fnr family transcriptional regulator [Anaerolineae bacterium]|nr:Crp/Fnr family transcriptional regulator [Anaerolineae bacterium]
MQTPPPKATLPRRISLLHQVPLFANFKEEDLARLVRDFRLKSYGKDEIIFRQGEHSHELYIVFSGKVRIFCLSPAGNETSITIYSNYDLIGEFGVIDDQPRSATAKTITPTSLLAMSQDRFLHHLQTVPDLALGLARLLTRKVRWTTTYAETIAQYDAPGRLLHILLLYNQQYGEEKEAGKRYELDLALNQSDLASLVGARRQWVNRILQDWRKRGLIEYDSGKIIILDLPRVEAERDSRIEANQAEW